MTAHITRISISGLRTLEGFDLDLGGLTVLMGENGCGKSSVIEAFELLRRLTTSEFNSNYHQIHGGDGLLLRHGSREIQLFVEIAESGTWRAGYDVAFSRAGVHREGLFLGKGIHSAEFQTVVSRAFDTVEITSLDGDKSVKLDVSPYESAISQKVLGHPDQFVRDAIDAIRHIDVHLPFDTLAHWAARSQGSRIPPMRDSVTVAPSPQLDRFGANLPNAYFALRNESSGDQWDYTMELVRMGLGEWVESVNTRSDASGGKIGLWIKPRHTDVQIPAASLSEGQLAYLAFVALTQLPTERSVLCFDELELHLHPKMLNQVLYLLEVVAERIPVVVTTHSRRLLDLLSDPASSVAILDFDSQQWRTELRRFDAEALSVWLKDYDGLGKILDAGYQESFLSKPTS